MFAAALLLGALSAAARAAPVVSAVSSANVFSTVMRVDWNTDTLSDSQVQFGPTSAYGSTCPVASPLVLSHSQYLTGLQPGALYHYQVISVDGQGNRGTGPDGTFTTPALSSDWRDDVTAYWRMDDPPSAAPVFQDASGNGNVLECRYNFPPSPCPTIGAPGVLGQAFSFAGGSSAQLLSTENDGGVRPLPDQNASFTVALWYLQQNPIGGSQLIFGRQTSSPSTGFLVYTSNYGQTLNLQSRNLGGSIMVSTAATPALGQWHHLALVYSSSSYSQGVGQLYLDGGLAAQASGLISSPQDGGLSLAGGAGGLSSFQGELDEAIVVGRALSSSDVQGLYASYASGGPMQSLGRPPSLAALPDQNVPAGHPLSVHLNARDPDFDIAQIQALTLPQWAMFDPLTGTLSWMPNVSQEGINPVSFQVADSGGRTAQTSFNLVVGGPVQQSVWLSASPGCAVSCAGTQTDPYDASSAAKFDALMPTISSYTTVNLLAGTYQTGGSQNWNPKIGWQIVGAGMLATTLQLINAPTSGGAAVIGSIQYHPPPDGLVVSSMTLDVNFAASSGDTCLSGISISASHVRISYVRVIDYGSGTNGCEDFPLILGPDQAVNPADVQYVDGYDYTVAYSTITQGTAGACYVTMLDASGGASVPPGNGPTGYGTGYIHGVRFHDNYINGSPCGLGAGHAITTGSCLDCVAYNNVVSSVTAGYYQDTWTTNDMTLTGNTFSNVGVGVTWNLYGANSSYDYTVNWAVVDGNTFQLAPGGTAVNLWGHDYILPSYTAGDAQAHTMNQIAIASNTIQTFGGAPTGNTHAFSLTSIGQATIVGNTINLSTGPQTITLSNYYEPLAQQVPFVASGNYTSSGGLVTANPPPLPQSQVLAAVEGRPLNFTVSFADQGAPASVQLSSTPIGAVFNSATGQFSWTPSAGQWGQYFLTFLGEDGSGTVKYAKTWLVNVAAAAPGFTDGLSAFWKFSEPSGSVSFSTSAGLNIKATCNGSSCPQAGVAGLSGSGLQFNGSQALSIPDSSGGVLADGNGAFSIAFWFDATSLSQLASGIALMTNENYLTNGFRMALVNGTDGPRVQFWSSESGGTAYMTSQVIGANQWYYVTVVYDGLSTKMYLNGVPTPPDYNPDQTGNYTMGDVGVNEYARVYPNTNNIAVGGGIGGHAAFTGLLDELALWSRPLTDADVLSNYSMYFSSVSGLSYSATAGTLAFNWSAWNGPGTLYSVLFSTAPNPADPPSGVLVTSASVYATSFSSAGLAANTSYYFEIQASTSGQTSAPVVLGAATWALLPSSVTLSAVSSGSVTIAWNSSGGPGTLYTVLSSTAPNPSLPAGAAVASASTYAASTSSTGLVANTTYYFEVQAANDAGVATGFTAPLGTSTLAGAPSGFYFTTVATGTLVLAWTSGGPGELYTVLTSTAPDPAAPAGGVATASSTYATSFSTAGLNPAATYYFQVEATNNDGLATGYSAAVVARTLPVAPPGAPTLYGDAVSSAAIRWFWTGSGGLPSGFVLFTSTGGVVSSLGSGASYYLETGLSTAAAYSRYLQASNQGGRAFSSTTTIAVPSSGDVLTGISASTLTGGDGASLVIPISLLGGATSWLLSEAPLQRPLMGDTAALISSAAVPAGLQESTGSLTEFILAVNGARSTATLAVPLTVSVPYPDSLGAGFVDGTSPPVRAVAQQLYVLDEATDQWTPVPGSSVDMTRKLVTGPIAHLSIFAAFGAASAPAADLGSVRVYPVPYRPDGRSLDAGGGGTGIFFDQLPASAEIKIYTVGGQLVTSFDASSAAGLSQWDARNDKGRDVASGLYLAVISSPGRKSVTKKLIIIR